MNLNTIKITVFVLVLPLFLNAQQQINNRETNEFIDDVPTLNLEAAQEMLSRVQEKAHSMNKNATVVILDAGGRIILAARRKNIGPHNTEAARRKAFTALSTKSATLALARKVRKDPDSQNLNTLPELLLLSGGAPVYWKGYVVGSVGIAGGGGAEKDDAIAKAAQIPENGITTIKK